MKLVGKTVYFYHHGYRSGRVLSLALTKSGTWKSMIVALPEYRGSRFRYTGRHIRLYPRDFHDSPLHGYLYRGRIRPLPPSPT